MTEEKLFGVPLQLSLTSLRIALSVLTTLGALTIGQPD